VLPLPSVIIPFRTLAAAGAVLDTLVLLDRSQDRHETIRARSAGPGTPGVGTP
jgi:hypothetical protein